MHCNTLSEAAAIRTGMPREAVVPSILSGNAARRAVAWHFKRSRAKVKRACRRRAAL
jgi:hypothetical protein